jgi:hypothetical protein
MKIYEEGSQVKYLYIVYSGECSLYKNTMIKKDDLYNKYYKNVQVMKITKGDILGLEGIDTEPKLTYSKSKDKACKLEKLSIKKVEYGYSLIVIRINLV